MLADLSIRNKIAGIILVTTCFSLIAAVTLFTWKSIRSFRAEQLATTALIGEVVREYNIIHLAFDDREGAEDSIALLTDIPSIIDAYIWDQQQELFVGYSRQGAPELPSLQPPPSLQRPQIELDGDYAAYFAPMIADDRSYGTLFLRTKTEIEKTIRDYLLFTAALMVALLVAAVFCAYWLQGFISKPILRLAAAARRISNEGEYTLHIERPGDDEIGVLYDGVNAMLGQIRRRQEELERSNRDLDQFAYVASHDLKAPLRAIATLSAWMEEDLGDKLSAEGKEQMRLLRNRVRRMDALIVGILKYSRLSRLEDETEEVDVGALLADVVDLLPPRAEAFEIEIVPPMPRFTTHRLRLQQVFANLITNAVKYHHRENGRVTISARQTRDAYVFTVEDDGPGIAPVHHERIFKIFRTLEPKDRDESTGLGLSLVKKLVEDEGGKIELDSDVGQGARFRFTWPFVDGAGHPDSGFHLVGPEGLSNRS